MNPADLLKRILEAVQLVDNIARAGAPLVTAVKAAFANHGVEFANQQLQEVIDDAARRQKLAEKEAQATE